MNDSLRIAASNREMYSLLSALSAHGLTLFNADGEPFEADPLEFHHLPRVMQAMRGAQLFCTLTTTRFGVSDGKPVCYPGAVTVEACCPAGIAEDLHAVIRRSAELVMKPHPLFVFPDAASFVQDGSVIFTV